jgi:subtilisin-like proprotein convertase family protein
MKTVSKLICTAGLVGMAATASAQVFWSTDKDVVIPDGDLNGTALITTIGNLPSGTKVDINSFRVYLDIVGDPFGGNGDLDIWLKSPTASGGIVVQLVNRPGYTGVNGNGYQDSGMNVTLYDGTDPNGTHTYFGIQYYQTDSTFYDPNLSGVTGIFKTDGRNIDPMSSGTAFDAAERTKTIAGLQGIDPTGDWLLFAADVSAGGNSTIRAWGIDLTPIPEPQSYAMAIGAGLMAFAVYRRRTLKSA